jgi:hypothetical protein
MKNNESVSPEGRNGAALTLAPPGLDADLRRIMEHINLELPGEPSRTIVSPAPSVMTAHHRSLAGLRHHLLRQALATSFILMPAQHLCSPQVIREMARRPAF